MIIPLSCRKYRILDDCSRFREIVGALPPKRHFVPSILIIYWGEGDQTSNSNDFFDMVCRPESHLFFQKIFTSVLGKEAGH